VGLVWPIGLTAAQAQTQATDAAPSGSAAQCRTDYVIDARLDGETKRIEGKLTATWTNGSADTVGDLWFHLYHNAFSNNRSTHLVEAGGSYRDVEAEDGWGWARITSIEVLGADGAAHDVHPSLRYRRPDDEETEDRTVFSVDLPASVAPGEVLTHTLTWESQLPRVRRRTGYKDDFILAAHWFPKLGVYEEGRGWNCHQFHASTEFYADFGTYDVTLDLPPEYENKVFGSGVDSANEMSGGRYKVSFNAPSRMDRQRTDAFGKQPLVHGFAWTADPRYVVVKEGTFRFTEWAERFPSEVEQVREALGRDVDVTLRPVDVHVLVHPERASQIDRHFEATCAALFFYGLWYGEYPYERVTVVDPAWGAGAAAGMEYPTLFTCGTGLFTTPDMHRPESVTVHECGHQFWYGVVGNNEFEAAWLDEGLNSFTDSEVMWRVYGARRSTTDFARIPIDGTAVAGTPGGGIFADAFVGKGMTIPLPILPTLELKLLPDSGFVDLWRTQPSLTFVPEWTDPRWHDRVRYLADPDTDPIETNAWQYADSDSYRTNSYPRPAVALRSLPAVIGHGPFLRGMRHFASEWRYEHPYPADFYETFQAGAEVDVDWYFQEVFRGTGTVDWSVRVSQERRAPAKGFFQSESGEFFEQRESKPDADEKEGPWVLDVEVRREGELRLPVDIRLTFEDGSVEDLSWSRDDQASVTWMRIERVGDVKLVSAVVDPERRYYLDTDLSNNQWYDETGSLAQWRWGERVLAQYQRYFHWIAGLGG
jgi:hypothetical protein